jgi:hypothetical protein
MHWQYSQSTGKLTFVSEAGPTPFVLNAYAGHKEGINNPEMQHVFRTGPLPRGKYKINTPHNHSRLGPFVMFLQPDPENEMFGRSAFYFHGDNSRGDRSGSWGCIITGRSNREHLWNSGVRDLVVVA